VYLDTVLLLGSLAGAHGAEGRWWFAAGAGLGSVAWFAALGAGARHLAPLFQRRNAWRVLDAGIAVVMIALAVLLLA
jgi:L-lysine exporter family protein LysE/ArgO